MDFSRNLDRNGSMEGLNAETVKYDTFPLSDSDGELRSEDCGYPLPGADGLAVSPHIPLMFQKESMQKLAMNSCACLSDAYGGVDALGGNTAIIHGVGMSAPDVQVMAADGMKLIWSPRIEYLSLWRNCSRDHVP